MRCPTISSLSAVEAALDKVALGLLDDDSALTRSRCLSEHDSPPTGAVAARGRAPSDQYPWGVIYTSLFVVAGPPPTHPAIMLALIEYP
jgi:hypothetical protein